MDRSRRRRAAIVALAGVVALVCSALGFWQLQRLSDRRARNAAIEGERSRDPRPVTSARTNAPLPAYTPVRVTGTFDAEREVLVYGRPFDGRSGHWLLTPLVFDDGSAILVVRGWVPFAYQRAPVAEAAPPDGAVTIRGFLLPDEGDGASEPDTDRVIGRVHVEGIASVLPYPVYPSPIQLTESSEPHRGDLPVPIGWPEISEGPHLSYAIQWFSFASIAVAGAVVLLRRERRGPTPGAT
jgi:cytochrome oxidase assembly protein ShyY1